METAQGSYSHELKPFVNRSSSVQLISQKQLDANKRIKSIERRISPTLRVIIEAVVVHHPDKPLSQVFRGAKRARLDTIKGKLRDGLYWLAVEYGLITANAHPFDPMLD